MSDEEERYYGWHDGSSSGGYDPYDLPHERPGYGLVSGSELSDETPPSSVASSENEAERWERGDKENDRYEKRVERFQEAISERDVNRARRLFANIASHWHDIIKIDYEEIFEHDAVEIFAYLMEEDYFRDELTVPETAKEMLRLAYSWGAINCGEAILEQVSAVRNLDSLEEDAETGEFLEGTLLNEAVRNNSNDWAVLFLSYDFSLEIEDIKGNTPFQTAVENGNYVLAKMFFDESGAEDTCLDKYIALAETHQHEENSTDEAVSTDSEDDEEYEFEPLAPRARRPTYQQQLALRDWNQRIRTGEVFEGADSPPITAAFYRGVHYKKGDVSKAERKRARRTFRVGKSIVSSAAYELEGVDYFADDEGGLLTKAQEVRRQLRALDREEVTRNPSSTSKKRFKRPSHFFQHVYTNDYDGIHRRLQEKRGIFSNFTFSRNPVVSSAQSPRHGLRYVLGQKFLGRDANKLQPHYRRRNAKPKHPYLGCIYIIMCDHEKLKELDPAMVMQMHAKGDIKVYTYSSKNVLSEGEVSFHGFVPGDCVVFERQIRVPNFDGGYQDYYLDKYGLDRRWFLYYKARIMETGFGTPERDKRVKSLIDNRLLKHYERELIDVAHDLCPEGHMLCYRDLDDGYAFEPVDWKEAKRRGDEARDEESDDDVEGVRRQLAGRLHV